MPAWNAQLAVLNYRPSAPADVDHATLAGRLSVCQTCPLRTANKCRPADQLVSVLARRKATHCPRGLWENGRKRKTENRKPIPSKNLPPRTYPETAYRSVLQLAAVTCHYNPCGYRRLEDNYFRFRQALPADLPLWTIELAYDDQPFRLPEGPRMIRIRGTSARHTLWQKERLLNLAIQNLPARFDAVAWLDADLIWLNGDWKQEAIERLKRYNVVQLFGGVADTDAAGQVLPSREGYVRARSLGQSYGRPGGAWAARRECIQRPAMYDRHIIGGGDSAMVHAWEEANELPISLRFGQRWREHFEDWARQSQIGRSMTYVPGDVVHLYHGTRERRQYVPRYQILREHDYDPAADVEICPATRLLQWSDAARRDKPEMIRQVAEYFRSRKEDD